MTSSAHPALSPATTDYPTLVARLPERIVCLTEETTETIIQRWSADASAQRRDTV